MPKVDVRALRPPCPQHASAHDHASRGHELRTRKYNTIHRPAGVRPSSIPNDGGGCGGVIGPPLSYDLFT